MTGRIAAVLLLCLAARAGAQGGRATLEVRVLDDSTGAPVPNAEVAVDSLRVLRTDSAGRLRYYGLAPGERSLKVSRLGYRPQRLVVRLAAAREMAVEVALSPAPLLLPEVRFVLKEMEGRLREVRFYERRRRGGGVWWGWREIRSVAPGGDVETLLSRLPGFRVRPGAGDSTWSVVSHRGPGLPDACAARVLLDGQPVDGRRLSGLSAEHLAGVEAYAGPATTPAELAGLAPGARCGVVALWSRNGP